MQLLWNRTVNVHGCPEKNIPCDLHMEHLNRECKGSISGLGANITDGAIQRVGRSLRSHTKILENFDKDCFTVWLPHSQIVGGRHWKIA